jgi:nucleoside-diphosphate-sugar epimerase
MSRPKRILVTGGAGAIGTNLVRRLLTEGAEVTVVDNLTSGHESNVHDGVTFVRGDISDAAVIDDLFKTSYNEIYHLAAFFANQNSCEFPLKDFRTNAWGSMLLFEAAQQQKELQTFLYASTSSIDTELKAGLEQGFSTPYMTSKYVGELYARYYIRAAGLPIRVVRYFNCYGPGEYPGRYRNVIINFIDKALRGESLTITGDGSETRDYTFVDDIVAGTLAVARAPHAASPVYEIGTGRETSVLDLARLINEFTGNDAAITFSPRRSWDRTMRRRANTELTQRDTGYVASVAFEDGLRRTVDWYKRVRAS